MVDDMIKHIKNVDINYIDYGKGKNTLVFLHGWGQNINMMKPVGDKLLEGNRIIIIDLPGFGESSEPNSIYTIYDYAEIVNELLKSLNINNPVLIGHSFGGKISLVYASKYKVEKLILFGSPFKKEIEKLSLKTKALKFFKKVPLVNKLEGFAKKHIGSTDYKNASSSDIKYLIDLAHDKVLEEYGINMKIEQEFVNWE